MPESSFLIRYCVCGLLHNRAQGLGQCMGVVTEVIPITFSTLVKGLQKLCGAGFFPICISQVRV